MVRVSAETVRYRVSEAGDRLSDIFVFSCPMTFSAVLFADTLFVFVRIFVLADDASGKCANTCARKGTPADISARDRCNADTGSGTHCRACGSSFLRVRAGCLCENQESRYKTQNDQTFHNDSARKPRRLAQGGSAASKVFSCPKGLFAGVGFWHEPDALHGFMKRAGQILCSGGTLCSGTEISAAADEAFFPLLYGMHPV